MIWTNVILVLAIALFLAGGMLIKVDAKKPTTGSILAKKFIKLVSIILIAGCVCRLYTPYYLTSVNPVILQEMVEAMQKQQEEEKNKLVRTFVRDHGDEMAVDAPILGNPEAKNTIYVWTAASCGYCRRVHGELDRVLKERDDVRVVIKNFSIHGVMSDGPARAMIAAKMQDNAKAAKFVDMVFTREYRPADEQDQGKVAEKIQEKLMEFAAEAGLDTAKLAEDMNSEVVSRELSNVSELATRFNITGTPFLIINDQAFPGAIPASQILGALK